jgi:hypothetical protein
VIKRQRIYRAVLKKRSSCRGKAPEGKEIVYKIRPNPSQGGDGKPRIPPPQKKGGEPGRQKIYSDECRPSGWVADTKYNLYGVLILK